MSLASKCAPRYDVLALDVFGVLFTEHGLNTQLLTFAKAFQSLGKRTCLVTNMGVSGLQQLNVKFQLQNIFPHQFCSEDLGVSKPDVRFYQKAEAALDILDPTPILYVDDAPMNINAAQSQGWQSFLYIDMPQLEKDILKTL